MLNSLSVVLRSAGSGDSEERKSRDEPEEEEDDKEEIFTIEAIDAYRASRKPSVEQLVSGFACLKPTFQSILEPRGGHSPPPPFVRWPEYGSLNQSIGESDDSPPNTPLAKKLSTFTTLANLLCYFLGVGLLGLPYVVATTGWCGCFICVLFAITNSSTAIILARVKGKLKFARNYQELADMAFGLSGRMIVSLLFYSSIFLDMIVYLHLFSVTIATFFPAAASSSPGSDVVSNWSQVSLISTVCFVLIQNLCVGRCLVYRYMSIVGAVGSVVLTLLLIGLLSSQIWQLTDVRKGGDASSLLVSVLPLTFYKGPRAVVRSWGVLSYCFSGHAVIPSIVHKMETPSDFPLVVLVCFSIITFFYCLVGSLGYIVYGPFGAYGKKFVFMLFLLDNRQLADVLLKLAIIVVVSAKSLLALQPLVDSAVGVIKPYIVGCLLKSLERELESEGERDEISAVHRRQRGPESGWHHHASPNETTFLGTDLELSQTQRLSQQVKKGRALFLLRLALRTLLPLAVLGVALVKPFSDFISLLSLCGALSTSISIIIPLLLFTEVFKEKLSRFDWALCAVVELAAMLMCVVTVAEFTTQCDERTGCGEHGGIV